MSFSWYVSAPKPALANEKLSWQCVVAWPGRLSVWVSGLWSLRKCPQMLANWIKIQTFVPLRATTMPVNFVILRESTKTHLTPGECWTMSLRCVLQGQRRTTTVRVHMFTHGRRRYGSHGCCLNTDAPTHATVLHCTVCCTLQALSTKQLGNLRYRTAKLPTKPWFWGPVPQLSSLASVQCWIYSAPKGSVTPKTQGWSTAIICTYWYHNVSQIGSIQIRLPGYWYGKKDRNRA